MLGHVAGRNRIGRMRLGVGVTDTGRRNPAVTAQAAATLHLLTRGRAILGIGPGEREGNEPYGVDWSKPVARFEEAMATIRALWDSGGQLVNRDSPYFPLRNAIFALPPHRGKWPEIWIGAHGPRMLRAVGRYGDAYFPGFPHRPKDYAQRLEVVRAAASDAGRDPMSIIPAVGLPVVTGRSRDDVDEALESELLRAMGLNASDEVFARHGGQHPLGAGFSGAQDILPQHIDEQTALSYVEQIPPTLLREVLLNGTPDEIIGQAAQWRDCGVRYMVLLNISHFSGACVKGWPQYNRSTRFSGHSRSSSRNAPSPYKFCPARCGTEHGTQHQMRCAARSAQCRPIGRVRLKTKLELNRSAHHWDERNRLLSPENGIGSAIEVVE